MEVVKKRDIDTAEELVRGYNNQRRIRLSAGQRINEHFDYPGTEC